MMDEKKESPQSGATDPGNQTVIEQVKDTNERAELQINGSNICTNSDVINSNSIRLEADKLLNSKSPVKQVTLSDYDHLRTTESSPIPKPIPLISSQYEVFAVQDIPSTKLLAEHSTVSNNDSSSEAAQAPTITAQDIIDEAKSSISDSMEGKDLRKNDFPINVFPDKIKEIITSTNECLNFPVDFTGAAILYAASIAIGNTFRVEVKKGWLESAVIYLILVANSGTNKTHPLRFILKPLIDHDSDTFSKYEADKKEYEKEMELSIKKSGDSLSQPYWEKYLIDDYTPEALAFVHKCNLRGIGVYTDEIRGWFKNFNKYNKGSEMEFWLSTWSVQALSIDRKTVAPIHIKQPFISVAGTIQCDLLYELAKDGRTQNGFLNRVLFVILQDLERPYWSDTEIGEDIIDQWAKIINNLLKVPLTFDENNRINSTVLKFAPDAKEELYKWQKINVNLSNKVEYDSISGIYSKLEVYVIRLSLILSLLNAACEGVPFKDAEVGKVDINAVKGAIKLAEYFRISANTVHAIISNSDPLAKYPSHNIELFDALPPTFSTEEGLKTAMKYGFAERTFKRFLNEESLFKRLKRGFYKKNILSDGTSGTSDTSDTADTSDKNLH